MLNGKQKKRLLELLDKGLAYDDEHYHDKIIEADKRLIDNIKKQLEEGTKIKRTFTCWKCHDEFEATIILGKTETVTCPCCERENRVRR